MYGNKREMSTIQASPTSWGGNQFWGLVQQKGPWKTTKADEERAIKKKPEYGGGGTGTGGTKHAGNGNWQVLMTPNQLNGSAAPLHPSEYAMKSVLMGSVDMKKQTKMGRSKFSLTLASRSPFQTGHKMGHVREEIKIDEPGQVKGEVELPKEGPFISEKPSEKPSPVPHYTPPPPTPDQGRASEIARNDERKAAYEKRRASTLMESSKAKQHEYGFGDVGFKRKGSASVEELHEKAKRLRSKGPPSTKRKADQQIMSSKEKQIKQEKEKEKEPSSKRKADQQIMSEKYKKVKKEGKPKLTIQTQNIGPRFIEKKAERKSAPKKHDELPRVRAKRKSDELPRVQAKRIK